MTRGQSLGKSSATYPSLPPGRIGGDKPGNAQGRSRQSHPESWAEISPQRQKGRGAGPGRGGGRLKELGVFRSEPRTAFCLVGPRRHSLRASRALTVQGQEVPAQVHARRAARHGGSRAPRDTRARRQCRRQRVRAECGGGPNGLRWEEAGGGPGTLPRPPPACAPAPPDSSTRVSPRPLLGIGVGGQSRGWEVCLTLAPGG